MIGQLFSAIVLPKCSFHVWLKEKEKEEKKASVIVQIETFVPQIPEKDLRFITFAVYIHW